MEVTSFDTRETQLYKLALEWNVETKMIIVLRPDSNTPEFINAEKIIRDNLQELDLSAIETFLRIKSKKSWQDKIIDLVIIVLGEDLTKIKSNFQNAMSYSESEAAARLQEYTEKINTFLLEQRSGKKYTFKLVAERHVEVVKIRYNSLLRTRRIVKEINTVHEKYANIMENPPLKSSNLVIVSENIKYALVDRITQNMPLADSILSIFDKVTLNRNVPHMICTDYLGVSYQKSYVPDPFESEIPSKFFLEVSNFNERSTIVFNVVDNNHYYTVVWTLDTGYAEVNNVRGAFRSKLDLIVDSLFPSIKLERGENLITEYELRLYPADPVLFILKEYILLHRLVEEDDVFQFYLNESTSPYPYKKTSELIFRYRPKWVTDYYIEDEVTFTIGLGSTMSDTNCLIINAISNSTIGIFRLFTNMIPAICIHYKEDLINEGLYSKLYSNIGPIDPVKAKTKTKIRQQLFDEFPEVFTEAYLYGGTSRNKVHKRNLVKITTDKALANVWKTQSIERPNQIIKRSVDEFYENKEDGGNFLFWYTTVTPDTPYLRLIENTREPNPKYPLVPGSSTAETESKKGKGEIVSMSILTNSLTALKSGRRGTIPPAFDIILPNCQRYGVNIGPNALLECILFAQDSERDYSQIQLAEIRLKIAQTINFWRLKQQLYDLEVKEIKQHLEDVDSYLDPELYIAALEEYFQLNIYVIVPTTESNITTMKFLAPRHLKFYARNAIIKKCIVIFCHLGVQSDNLKHKHCELIYNIDDQEDFLMSKEISARLQKIFIETVTTRALTGDNFYALNFMSSEFDLYLRKFKILSQYVDGCGKCRAVTFLFQDFPMTVITSPREPYNVDHTNEIKETDYAMIIDFCGNEPAGASPKGIWIPFQETNEILYFRVADRQNKKFKNVIFLDTDPLMSENEEESVVKTFAQKERDFAIITHLLKWALEVFFYETKDDYKSFSFIYLDYNKTPVDENTYYNTLIVTQVVPQVDNLNECIDYIKQVIPFKGGKLKLHSNSFLERINYILEKHQRAVRMLSSVKASKIIPNFYRSIFDFATHSKTQIHTGNVSIKQLLARKNPFDINDAIVYNENQRQPFVYSQKGTLYLVQNTILDDLGSALRVAYGWIVAKINLGYKPESMDSIQEILSYNFIIYKLVNGTLEPVFSNIVDNEPISLVLDYMFEKESIGKKFKQAKQLRETIPRKRYAALLKL